jgi:quinol monooxygenase YgiN
MNLRIASLHRQTDALMDVLRLQMGRTQVLPGCVQCRLAQDADEQNVIFYQEEWNSWEEIEKHIRSDRFSWILELMEQASSAPELNFNDIHETRGMEYVREVRTSNMN